MNIKAIETVYKGYKFRSRLEARWAVFFDTLGINYRYEHEGFDLDGIWYLPDFWLPDLFAWVEIKGQKPTEEEFLKAEKLTIHSLTTCFIIAGSVGIGEFNIHAFLFPEIGSGKYSINTSGKLNFKEAHRVDFDGLTTCSKCHGLWLLKSNDSCHPANCSGSPLFVDLAPHLIEAYIAARQARFDGRDGS